MSAEVIPFPAGKSTADIFKPGASHVEMPWLEEAAEVAALEVACALPICKAPAGEVCRTGSGQPRPAHSKRLHLGKAAQQVKSARALEAAYVRQPDPGEAWRKDVAFKRRTCCASVRGGLHEQSCGG